jgi:hypothetical protein
MDRGGAPRRLSRFSRFETPQAFSCGEVPPFVPVVTPYQSRPVEDREGNPALAGVRNVVLDDPSPGRPDSHCNFGGGPSAAKFGCHERTGYDGAKAPCWATDHPRLRHSRRRPRHRPRRRFPRQRSHLAASQSRTRAQPMGMATVVSDPRRRTRTIERDRPRGTTPAPHNPNHRHPCGIRGDTQTTPGPASH